MLRNLPIVGALVRRARARREAIAEDPFQEAQLREERLWLLALLIIFLLAVSLFLITATGDVSSAVPEIAAPLMLVLGSDITTCFLLVMVLLITAYIRERLHAHWTENRRLIEELTQKERTLKKKDTQLTTWGELSHALIANFDLPRLLDLVGERRTRGRPHRLVVLHADGETRAWNLMSAARDRFDPDEMFVSELNPTLGIHVGPGAIGLAYSSGI